MQRVAEDKAWNLKAVQGAFPGLRPYAGEVFISEVVSAVWVESGSNQLQAILLVPKTSFGQGRLNQFAMVEHGAKVRMLPMEGFSSVMATFGLTVAKGTDKPRTELLP